MANKISCREIDLELISDMLKYGMKSARIIENPLWEGAILTHFEFGSRDKTLRLWFFDEREGEEIPEGSSFKSIKPKITVFTY